MLPDYLSSQFLETSKRVSAELKSKAPNWANINDGQLELKKERAKEIAHRKEFEKRVSEIGFKNALIEEAEKADNSMAEAKAALNGVINYKR